jgi:alpha-glucosidase
MPWNGSANGGFTAGTPWLPLGADVANRNVAAQRDDARSELSLYRRLIALRREEPVLLAGSYAPLAVSGSWLSYERRLDDRRLFVALNIGHEPTTVKVSGAGKVVLSSYLDREAETVESVVRLRGDEAVIIDLHV